MTVSVYFRMAIAFMTNGEQSDSDMFCSNSNYYVKAGISIGINKSSLPSHYLRPVATEPEFSLEFDVSLGHG